MNDLKPTIVIDNREQLPLMFKNLPSVPGTLTSGDYSISGAQELFAVERKSIADLVQSCTTERDRFERELHRLRGFRFARLLIVGAESEITTHRYRSNASSKAILHSLWAFEARYNVPVIFEPLEDRAAVLIERWSYWFAREIQRTAGQLEDAHPADIATTETNAPDAALGATFNEIRHQDRTVVRR